MAGCELEIPERDDDAVVEAIKFLNGKLRTDLMKNYLKEAGEYLYVATNATAKDADQQIKVQSCLFDAVKLCDAWNLMLTSFKVGASDILEKLHIAFLKLLDGFPDFALADVQSVTKHVSSMKAACEKARGSFTKCRQELREIIAFLGTEKMKLEGNCNKSSTAYGEKIKRLERVCSVDKAFEREDSSLRLAYLEREEPRDKYQAVKKMIPNCVLAEEELCLALQKLDAAVEFLGKVERLVNDWYNECKEVVEKNMKLNVKHAEKMSEAKQKEFWKTLPFAQTAYQFLCRWKALQQICLSTSSHMRRVRGDIDWYYTENLYPSEAVQKAWELMKNHKDLPKALRPYPDMVVPEAGRNKALCFLPELMVLPSTPKDIFKLREYVKNVESIRRYMGIIESTGVLSVVAYNPVQKMKQDLGTLLNLLHSAAVKLSAHSFDAISKMHLTSLCILDGMSEAADRELNTIWDDRKDVGQVIGQIATYRAEINTGSFVALQKQLDGQVSQLETRLKKEVDDEVRATNPGNTERPLMKRGYEYVKSHLGAGPSDCLNSDNTTEQIKLSKFVKELLQLISNELPIMDIEGVYKRIYDDLNDQAILGREELRVVVEALQGETLGQEMRGPLWQEGIVRLMMQLKDLHIASRKQASSLKDVSDRIERRSTGCNWRECMAMVSKVDSAADSLARRINIEVDGEVQHIRAAAKEARDKELEEERQRQLEEEKRRREVADEKRRLQEEEERKKRRPAREKKLEEEMQKQLEERRIREAAEKKRQEEEERKKTEEERNKRMGQEHLNKEQNAKKEGSAARAKLPGHVVRNKNGTSSGTRNLRPNARERNVPGGSTKPNLTSGRSQSDKDSEMKSGSDEDETSFTKVNEALPDEAIGAHGVPEEDKCKRKSDDWDKLDDWRPGNPVDAEGTQQPSGSVDGASLADDSPQDRQKGDANAGISADDIKGHHAADDSSKIETQINVPGFAPRASQQYQLSPSAMSHLDTKVSLHGNERDHWRDPLGAYSDAQNRQTLPEQQCQSSPSTVSHLDTKVSAPGNERHGKSQRGGRRPNSGSKSGTEPKPVWR